MIAKRLNIPTTTPTSRAAASEFEAISGATEGENATTAEDRRQAAASAAFEQEGVNADAPALLDTILASLDEDKAEDVVTIDLRGKSSIADHMVIASGRSSRHVAAICEKLIERLKALGGTRPRSEGVENGDWALIDAVDVVVHVFRPEVRDYYALEKMWAPNGDRGERQRDAARV